jgi:tRNA1Val (adenine37-N6)-methyltransferase
MSNSYFKFKQFTVYQDKTAMKVGVDGVLLGAWANTDIAMTILDIGTGTGLLSLMMAQKSKASITAIDIDIDSCHQAKLNIKNSLWNSRIAVEQVSFQDFYKQTGARYDVIICNPPYFVKSLKSPDIKRNLARHDDLLPLDILFDGVSKLLSETGRFYIIYPYSQKEYLDDQASKNKLYAIGELIVKGTINKKANRIVVEYSRQYQECITEELIVRDQITNDYTGAYKKLTGEFYLAF